MEKTFYEVKTFTFETKNGKNALDAWNNQRDKDYTLVKRCENLDEAKAVYATVYSGCRSMGSYYYHEGKCIEENTYDIDDDGEEEWVSGGDDWLIDCGERTDKEESDDE